MRTLGTILTVTIALAGGTSCAKLATPAECKAKCEKHLKFAGPTTPVADPVKTVEADFDAKIKNLQKEQLTAITAIDKEMQSKLAEATDEAAKTKIGEEFKAMKSRKAKEFAPRFAEMNRQKGEAVKTAKEVKAKEAAKAKATADKDKQDCADKCLKDRTTKASVDCQIKASSLEELGTCP